MEDNSSLKWLTSNCLRVGFHDYVHTDGLHVNGRGRITQLTRNGSRLRVRVVVIHCAL